MLISRLALFFAAASVSNSSLGRYFASSGAGVSAGGPPRSVDLAETAGPAEQDPHPPRLVAPMMPRSLGERHRTATPLELFVDLVFVVAVAQASSGLHHAVADRHVADGLIGYAMAFFGLWWAWMNFTWFASAYDCDDVPYRLAVFVQMTGALIFAAGVPALAEGDLGVGVAGYVVMRLAAVGQWLRAATSDPPRRATARRYALGIGLVQLGWIGLAFAPSAFVMPGFLAFLVVELLIPAWAERAAPTTWHPHHIAERFGLMTIIVLGESILAATVAIQSALRAGEAPADVAPVIVGGLLIVFSLWWLYFYRPVHDLLSSLRRAFVWGYGHYFVFASAAAVGAGLAVAVDQATGHAAIGSRGAGLAVAIPVAVYLICLWILHHGPGGGRTRYLGPLTALLVLLTPVTAHAVPLTGLLLAALLTVKLAAGKRADPETG